MASSMAMTEAHYAHHHLRDFASQQQPQQHMNSSFPYYGADDDFSNHSVNLPMKFRERHSTHDHAFPSSPYLSDPPSYFGAFGVSAPSTSATSVSESSPSLNAGSNINSSGALSTDGGRPYQEHPSGHADNYPTYQQQPIHNTPPLLNTPNPDALRPGKKSKQKDGSSSRSRPSKAKSVSSSGASHPASFQDPLSPLPIRRKRKTNAKGAAEGDYVGEMNPSEQILMELAEEGLPWKEIAARFYERTGKNMKVPALQMRLKRLRERLRKWTETEVCSLNLATSPGPYGSKVTKRSSTLTRP